VDATKAFNPELPLLCQVDTETWRLGKAAGLRTVAEAFVDRAYTPEGLLVPRSEPNAMYKDPQEAANRAAAMATGDHIRRLTERGLRSMPRPYWCIAIPMAPLTLPKRRDGR